MIRIRKGSCGTTLRDVSRGMNQRSRAPVVIGLVNNMPDGALQATERQFCDLLAEASDSLLIFLRFFSIPELHRSEAGRAYVSHHYEDIGEMLTDRLDGLIVTGAEPRAPELSDEPYWPTMTKIVDWAEDHTTSTVWSCLAAHAAVLHSRRNSSPAFSREAFGRIRVREGRGPRDRVQPSFAMVCAAFAI